MPDDWRDRSVLERATTEPDMTDEELQRLPLTEKAIGGLGLITSRVRELYWMGRRAVDIVRGGDVTTATSQEAYRRERTGPKTATEEARETPDSGRDRPTDYRFDLVDEADEQWGALTDQAAEELDLEKIEGVKPSDPFDRFGQEGLDQ